MNFDGATIEKADEGRLFTQLTAVEDFMVGQEWWRTLFEIRANLKARYGVMASEASISARLRDLRKAKHGSYRVERRKCAKGLWEYRVLEPLPTGQLEML